MVMLSFVSLFVTIFAPQFGHTGVFPSHFGYLPGSLIGLPLVMLRSIIAFNLWRQGLVVLNRDHPLTSNKCLFNVEQYMAIYWCPKKNLIELYDQGAIIHVAQ